MDEQLVGTLDYQAYKADVYSSEVPGEFKVIYRDPSGKEVEEAPLTGISSYKQREAEIMDRLRQFSEGAQPAKTPYQGDSGEY